MTPKELNQQCIERLRSEALDTRVAFIGSGLSSPYIAPLARLRTELAARCGVVDDPAVDFWALGEEAFRNEPDEYYGVLREMYDDTPHWSSNAYLHLVSIPFLGFGTFNYDDQLPAAFRSRNSDPRYFSVYPPRNGQRCAIPGEFLSPPQRLIALHGYCDPGNPGWEKELILKTSDYNKHYIDPPHKLLDWWGDLLLSIPCIFIGTSLREPGLFKVLKHFLEDHRPRLAAMRHLHLMGVRSDPKTGEYPDREKSLGVIDRVYFDPIDTRYTGLITILAAFSGLPIDRPSPRAAAPTPISATDPIDFDSL